MVDIGVLVICGTVVFFMGYIVSMFFENQTTMRYKFEMLNYKHESEKYREAYVNMKSIVTHLTEEDVELVQRDYATFIISKNVDSIGKIDLNELN